MQVSLELLAGLYLAFAGKQYAADYLLQTTAMARGKAAASGWAMPLGIHAATHGALTLLIVLVAAPELWWLGPFDVILHGAIDRGKALATRELQPSQALFWRAFGADQLAHQMTHFAYVVLILRAGSAAA